MRFQPLWNGKSGSEAGARGASRGISRGRQRAGGAAGGTDPPLLLQATKPSNGHPHLHANASQHPHGPAARGQRPQASPKPRQHRTPAPGAARIGSQTAGEPSLPQAERSHATSRCRTCILVFTTSKGVLPKTLAAPARAPNTPVTKGLMTLLGSSPGKEERLRAEWWCGDEARHPRGTPQGRSQVWLLVVRACAVLSWGPGCLEATVRQHQPRRAHAALRGSGWG